jgi:hypothetical protein
MACGRCVLLGMAVARRINDTLVTAACVQGPSGWETYYHQQLLTPRCFAFAHSAIMPCTHLDTFSLVCCGKCAVGYLSCSSILVTPRMRVTWSHWPLPPLESAHFRMPVTARLAVSPRPLDDRHAADRMEALQQLMLEFEQDLKCAVW